MESMMPTLQNLLIFIVMTSLACATQDTVPEERQKYTLLIRRMDENISELKRKQHDNFKSVNEEKDVLLFFDAYMQKAAGHFHLGEQDKQLKCYQEILGIKGLSKLNIARTHVNISVVYLHLGRNLAAAGYLQKAEEIISLSEIVQVIGSQTYGVFASIYDKTAQDLYLHSPQQALRYQKKIIDIPCLDEKLYGQAHLKLSILYDNLLNSEETLNHALQALKCKSLTSTERDKALCFAALGAGLDKPKECISYFNQIVDLKNLHKNEYHLLLMTVGSCYLRDKKWDEGIALQSQAIHVLDFSSPEYLFGKYHLATTYGKSSNKKKEMELYGEVLEVIKVNAFNREWQECMQSIQISIETFFFMQAIDELEQQAQKELIHGNNEPEQQKKEDYQKSLQDEKIKRKQDKAKYREKQHQSLIEQIKRAQREAVKKEQMLEEERKKKIEAERVRAEERKNLLISTPKAALEVSCSSQVYRHIPEQTVPKVKTRGVSTQSEVQEVKKTETQPTSEFLSPALPKLGTRAQTVFDKIEDEDWSFTREDYTYYLEDLRCKRRESGSSHRIFQLPKTTIISLEKDGQEMQEHIFLPDENIQLGSVTLPAWKEKKIPFYLRKQLRCFHEKIINIYSKITTISHEKTL